LLYIAVLATKRELKSKQREMKLMNSCSRGLIAAGICVLGSVGNVMAQADNFGSNNLYYNQKYNAGAYTNPEYDQYVSFNDFYTNLAPYGQWIEDEHYGFVWSPTVDNNFRPYYTNGRWAQTDYGNTWISDYPWGWACFHYGRWTFDTYYGWLWVPGSDWGPAWVSWRSGTGTFGWAPLSPDYEISAKELNAYRCPKDWWVMLPAKYLYGGNYYRYLTGPFGNSTVLDGTSGADNMYSSGGVNYIAGPTLPQAEKASDKQVTMYHLNNAGTPRAAYVHNDMIKMYKPREIKAYLATGEHPVPPAVVAAPRPVSRQPEAVNRNLGSTPEFKKALPGLLASQVYNAPPTQNTNIDNGTGRSADVIRADKNIYKTDVQVRETEKPKAVGGPLRKPQKTLPAQQPQQPEPVTVTNKREESSTTTRQHADPIPSVPQGDRPMQGTIPAQHPEPVNPSGK
jgi:hypothetical protein